MLLRVTRRSSVMMMVSPSPRMASLLVAVSGAILVRSRG